MSKDIKINLDAEALKRKVEYVSDRAVSEIRMAIKDLAFSTYTSILDIAKGKLDSTWNAYKDGLKLLEISPDNYVVYLEGAFPNALENGQTAYQMQEKLLRSKALVKTGSRAGQPWVQTSKAGNKYAHVPFEKKMGSAVGPGQAANLADLIKGLKAPNRITNKIQSMKDIFTDDKGSPLAGKVAVFKYPEADLEKGLGNPFLQGLTKYQTPYMDKNGKQRVKSLYMTYRTMSTKYPTKGWKFPGTDGVKAFAKVEAELDSKIKEILDALIR